MELILLYLLDQNVDVMVYNARLVLLFSITSKVYLVWLHTYFVLDMFGYMTYQYATLDKLVIVYALLLIATFIFFMKFIYIYLYFWLIFLGRLGIQDK